MVVIVSQPEILELSSELLSDASYLLVNYIYPNDDWGTSHQEECKQNLRRLLDFKNAELLMARAGDDFVGFIALNWGFSTTKGLPFLRIQDLYVLPQYRKKGIAKLLMNKAIEIAKQNNSNRIQLNTGSLNTNARNLYEALGFEWQPDKEIYMYFLN